MTALKAESNAEWLIALFLVDNLKDLDGPQLKGRISARVEGGNKKTEALLRNLTGTYISMDSGKYRLTRSARNLLDIYKVDDEKNVFWMEKKISVNDWYTITTALHTYERKLAELYGEIKLHLPGYNSNPPRIVGLQRATSMLRQLPNLPTEQFQPDQACEAIAISCREQRLALHQQKELLEIRVRDRQLLSDTEVQIGVLEDILNRKILEDYLRTPKPRLTDFVNVGVIEELKSRRVEEHENNDRPTDEKFGILTAPAKFAKDFQETADGAFARGRSFAVGFADIDNFKSVNHDYTETVVDRDLLPTFMRALEAYCYRRAYAYRQGGDEYLILLHNATADEARQFFEGLRDHLAQTSYPESVTKNPTISIGVHVIDDINEVTVFQAQYEANQAKDRAKDQGKNCVVLSSDDVAETTQISSASV